MLENYNILYLISNSFDYSKMICSDNGPEYSKDRGWATSKLNIQDFGNKILVVDNRIYPQDEPYLRYLLRNTTNKIVFKVVDGMEDAINNYVNQFLLSIPPKENIYFYSPYQSSYVFDLLKKKHGTSRCYFLPYVYNPDYEIPFDLGKKKNKLIVSGSISQYAYPIRWKIHTETHRKWWSFFKVDYLPHSGYPDIGMKQRHTITNEKYIQFLSHYMFMLVSPSVWDYELLKFRECAYAGCYPVGALASTIDLANKNEFKSFFSLQDNTKKKLDTLYNMPLEQKKYYIQSYREWFQKNRNREILNQGFINFLYANR